MPSELGYRANMATDITAGLDRGHFLSKTGNCKTFDDGADGYCRGEGVGTLVVKRLEDAKADNDPIVGIILSAYTNHSAEAESITRPHAGAQKAIFEKVLTSAAVDPFSIGYVEMHGTGTQAGKTDCLWHRYEQDLTKLSQVMLGKWSRSCRLLRLMLSTLAQIRSACL